MAKIRQGNFAGQKSPDLNPDPYGGAVGTSNEDLSQSVSDWNEDMGYPLTPGTAKDRREAAMNPVDSAGRPAKRKGWDATEHGYHKLK